MQKILAFIKLLGEIKSLWKYIEAYILKKKQDGQLGQIQEGEKKIEEAKKIEDDMERLKKKAEGAKQIEDSIRN